MWGGRRLPSEARLEAVRDPEGATRDLPGVLRDAFGLVLVLLGVPVVAVGAGIQWGPGAAVLACGLAMVLVGVLLGMGER